MGWSKNKGLRLYFERKGKSYLLVDTMNVTPRGFYEAIGEVLINNNPNSPMLCSTSAQPLYLYCKCRRASWDEMPPIWKRALRQWINGSPKKHRGLWRIRHES
jgi:hypothetical protein